MEEILKELSLKEREIEIYNFLFAFGPQPASLISRQLEINRSSVYLALGRMERLGFISSIWRNGTQVFMPTPAETLLLRAKKKQQSIAEKIRAAEEDVINLHRRKAWERNAPKIHYYQGESGLLQLLDNILLQRPKTVQAFIAGRFFDFLDNKVNDYPNQRSKRDIFARVIHPFGDDSGTWKSNAALRRETRTLPREYDQGIDVISHGENRTTLIAAGENFALSVESSLFRRIQNAIFQSSWLTAKAT
jgi:sugar-specific transcriptional regulator TrmB